ncbi:MULTISPECIES: DUF3710 domain-containing protein [Gordonia]|uniref:DUF3710 domain-containing protein n=1 Tax=Gordonia alkanivorans CGMCC 6845 TaxID=1423140 RepID=W9DLC0_9ACTN|nr:MULTISPECIES: DUF3710 domain-containing protein [Gordonia]ETA07900.1 hypothetical protein V525_05945 [Gordonia alkanivorans CGMCC 6845]MBA5848615.1 DUF3710 domain-containing protein [Gordonia amicalis]MDH3023343.1 DUF3710 domain-containing protein [Gordonia alkanivorans]MDH3044025.1 DUF3710 domain-containing protein [Gordonia alkanivorans]MDJ0007061.1 DUF3710 domain-containing protein [Gordonia alkanivorans]
MTNNGSDELRVGQALGPYDIDALATETSELENSHLDLGSVLVPVVEGGQVTVEMSETHQPQNVYLVTPIGRISVSAFAAPKSPGMWREVVRELAESLRDGGAATSIEDGHWGREVVAEVEGGTHRFIGVDGPRWLVRCVGSGPSESAEDLARLSRAVLAETVVRRGSEPHPPREPLPIVLPPVLADQVAAAQQQIFAEAEAEAGAGSQAQAPAPEVPAADESDGVAGGALDQVAHATVYGENSYTETPAVGGSGGHDDPSVTADPDPEDDAPLPPSSGSAMQRFFRRR